MGRPPKLNNTIREGILKDYQSGMFTRKELSLMYRVSPRSVDYVLSGIPKPFYYTNRLLSLDYLKERGREVPMHPLTPDPGYVTIVACPEQGCDKRYRSDRLLLHLVRAHHRHDLEYLVEQGEL